MSADLGLSVLIPAHNEAGEIGACLAAVFASDPLPDGVQGEVLVLANGCTDATAELARSTTPPAGWDISVLEITEGGKLNALNQGDAQAQGKVLVYLDADVRVSPSLLPQIYGVLSQEGAGYASGQPQVLGGASAFSRAYGRLWQRLPFVVHGVPGFGLFAMNRQGRARWNTWPQIIADDTYARLMFTTNERHKVAAPYEWPLVQGFRNLVRVRRRQNDGVREIEQLYPDLLENEDKFAPRKSAVLRLFLTDPVGFLTYALVTLAVKSPLFRSKTRWTRGR
ncbi:glycosyltransferase [Epibacterium ulvae]|uniref:glycosyltransferase family 2 protein n=1 Tax=Epibacterium ulvae TaxID=1156985 RepID=UPI001BFCCC9F|nr:glycosyltransferase [Epibacterium ulvae]MBT8153956.1 glycosyltransferase [Epibacterium ulvae]